MTTTLEELMDKAYDFQSGLINGSQPGDSSIATFVAENQNGELFMYGTPFDGDKSKQALIRFLRAEFKKRGIVRYVLATEAWMSVREKNEIPNSLPPSEDPLRRDVLMIIGVEKNGKTVCRSAKIVVADTNKRCVDACDPNMANDSYTGIGGRMSSLLQE